MDYIDAANSKSDSMKPKSPVGSESTKRYLSGLDHVRGEA
jgi:hypothetical protein